MNLQVGGKFKLTEVLYVPQAVKNILIISRIVSKGSKMGANKDKMNINKYGVSTTLDARKGINESAMFYLKMKIYAP